MPEPARLFGTLLLVTLLSAAPAGAGSEFVTSGGVVIPTPPPEEQSCAGLADLLREIDASGYRHGPRPAAPQDDWLLNYESQVAHRFYTLCADAGEPPPDPIQEPVGAIAETPVDAAAETSVGDGG